MVHDQTLGYTLPQRRLPLANRESIQANNKVSQLLIINRAKDPQCPLLLSMSPLLRPTL